MRNAQQPHFMNSKQKQLFFAVFFCYFYKNLGQVFLLSFNLLLFE